jgi:AraC family transcriptional regulator
MDGAIERAVGRVIVAMRDNLGDQLTIDDMARTAMFSKFHFSRVFQRVTGVSPGRFLSAVRFQEAKELLVSTELTVTDICHRVGYTSVGTFSSRFRRNVGVSPTAYRQLRGFIPPQPEERQNLPKHQTATVTGETHAPRTDRLGLIFVGLFTDRIPRSQPVRSAVLNRPGKYTITDVPQGSWYVLAHSVAAGLEHAVHGPFPAEQVLCVGRTGPIKIRPDTATITADVSLQPMHHPAPPELHALLDVRSAALSVTAA